MNYVKGPEAGSFEFISKSAQNDPRYGQSGLNIGDSTFNQQYGKLLADADFEARRTRFYRRHTVRTC